MQSAMRRHQAGDLTAAEKVYREILGLQPDHPDALQMLGILIAQRGDSGAAVDLLRRAIAVDPDQPGPYKHLAPLLARQRRFDEAVAAYRNFLELSPQPGDARIHRDLGAALIAGGRLDEAIAALSAAISLQPQLPAAHVHLGNALSKKRITEQALAAYRRAVELEPDSAAAHNGTGNMLRQCGRLDEAIAAYLTAVRLKPDFALAWFNLGQAYRSAGSLEHALSAYSDAVKLNPHDVEAHASMAVVLAELHRFDEALASHAKVAALAPDGPAAHEVLGEILMRRHDAPAAAEQFGRAVELNPSLDTAWNGLGLALQSQGKFEEAAKCFRRMLELCPSEAVGLVYRNLINTGTAKADSADIQRLTDSLSQPDTPVVSRIAGGFALGKFLDEAGRYEEAFARFAEANALVKRRQAASGQRYEPQLVQRQVDQVIEAFTPEFFERRGDWGEPSDLPVYIVGMPRSGTTLVQQIAASHPQVHGAGELSDIAEIVKALGGADVKSAALSWNRGALIMAAQRHIRNLQMLGKGASRVVDKMPCNVHRLGLISLLCPKARVIFCRREARDNCLSCYFQWFNLGNTFAYDLGHCGHEYLATQRLMEHWRRVLPLAMLDVQYEDLVSDLESQSRRLIDFLGLPWDPACLDFHRTETTVLTASSWQVRQPIYRNSVGRWRHYETHLGPLMEVLASR
jgi:tetratricopeptide (TPR) repeat protein